MMDHFCLDNCNFILSHTHAPRHRTAFSIFVMLLYIVSHTNSDVMAGAGK